MNYAIYFTTIGSSVAIQLANNDAIMRALYLMSILCVVKKQINICCELTWLCLMSPQHFDHFDDKYHC